MQESSVYRSIQREAQVEEKRASALSSLREGLPIEVIARITRLSVPSAKRSFPQKFNNSSNSLTKRRRIDAIVL